MNFVGHIATGLRIGDDPVAPEFLVGTALPDFAAMGRTRLGAADGSLGDGIALHHATDQAFHADAWFLDFERELRELLREDGLPDGAAPPAPTWARSCCSTARCSTTPRSRAA